MVPLPPPSVVLCVNAFICSVVSNSLGPRGLQPPRLLCPWDSPGKNTGGSCHFLLLVIFPTQRLKPSLLLWQADSLPLSQVLLCPFVQSLWSLTLCDPMDCSMPGFPVSYHLPELLKLMSIESVMLSSHLILCCPLLFLPSIFSSISAFLMGQFFTSGGQNIGAFTVIM